MKVMKYLVWLHTCAKEHKTLQTVKGPCGNTFSTSTYNADHRHQVSLQSADLCESFAPQTFLHRPTNQTTM